MFPGLEKQSKILKDMVSIFRNDGNYGTCVDCSKPISVGRLKAKPYARLCIDCKMLREANDGAAPEGVEDTEPVEE